MVEEWDLDFTAAADDLGGLFMLCYMHVMKNVSRSRGYPGRTLVVLVWRYDLWCHLNILVLNIELVLLLLCLCIRNIGIYCI